MNKRTNAGYTIIAEITIPGDQFVLGEKIDTDNNAQYVTWRSDGKDYYCYGRYFTNKKTALLNFYERARSEIEHRYNRLFDTNDVNRVEKYLKGE